MDCGGGFFSIVGAAGKGKIDIDQIDFNTLLLEVSAGGNALPADDRVTAGVPTHALPQLHIIGRYPAVYRLRDTIVIAVFQRPPCPSNIVQYRLPIHWVRIIRYVFHTIPRRLAAAGSGIAQTRPRR